MEVMLFDARAITDKPCGVRNVAENYIKELSLEYRVVAIVHPNARHLIPSNIECVFFNKRLSRFNPFSDFLISYLVLKLKPSVFFSPHSFLPFLSILPEKRIFICHDLFASLDKNFFKKKGVLGPIARLYFRIFSEISILRASHVVTPSAAIGRSLKGLIFSPRKHISIHNGINLRECSSQSNIYRKQILYIGNFRSYKGFDLIYEAWQKISNSSIANGWELKVVTNEPIESINLFLKNSNKLKNVSFLSRITNSELHRIRRESSICVIPSRYEGFGIPMLESIASGSHILCSNIEVFNEIIKEFKGYPISQFHSDDAMDLELELTKLMGSMSQVITPRIREEALDILSNKFSWKKSAMSIKYFYETQ